MQAIHTLNGGLGERGPVKWGAWSRGPGEWGQDNGGPRTRIPHATNYRIAFNRWTPQSPFKKMHTGPNKSNNGYHSHDFNLVVTLRAASPRIKTLQISAL